MSETIEIKLWVCTNKVRSQCETTVKVDKEEWDNMTESEKDQYMLDELHNSYMYEWGWSPQ